MLPPTGSITATFFLILLPILIGALLGRTVQWFDDRSVAICLLCFLFPAYLFLVLSTPVEAGKELGLIFFFLFFHTAALWIVTIPVLRIMNLPQRTFPLILLTVLFPHPFLFPPSLCPVVFGQVDPAAVNSLYHIFHLTLLAFVTIGVFLATPNLFGLDRIIDFVRFPIAPLAILGYALALLGVQVSPTIRETITPFSQCVPPITFLLLGVLIGKGLYLFELPSLTPMLVAAAAATFLRLVVSPALSFGILRFMPIEAGLARLLIIHTAMPTSVLIAILAGYYGQPGDKRYVVICTLVTVLLSLLTLPVVALLAAE